MRVFVPETAAPRQAVPDDVWIPVRGEHIGHVDGKRLLTVADSLNHGVAAVNMVCIGRLGDRLVWTGEATAIGTYALWSELVADPGYADTSAAILRAVQIVRWRSVHRFCGACQAPLADCPGYLSRRCPSCEQLYMVRLAPVVLVLVTHGDRALLVRHSYQIKDMWALVSGYLESGESVEDAARREVFEEVGSQLSALHYAGSSPSAFGDPDAVLLGYRGEAAGPELRVDPGEIADARWFTREEIGALRAPGELPPPRALARRMIDDFVAGRARSR